MFLMSDTFYLKYMLNIDCFYVTTMHIQRARRERLNMWNGRENEGQDENSQMIHDLEEKLEMKWCPVFSF